MEVGADAERKTLLTALTTEHFVLQTANNATYAEASARSTLYVMVLSSTLLAAGFVAGSTEVIAPFAAIVLPAVFLLGLFTVVRLVETKPALRTRYRPHPRLLPGPRPGGGGSLFAGNGPPARGRGPGAAARRGAGFLRHDGEHDCRHQ